MPLVAKLHFSTATRKSIKPQSPKHTENPYPLPTKSMSFHDRAVAALLAQLTLAADGALIGLGATYLAYRCIRKLTATSSAVRKISDAPCLLPSDLRSILSEEADSTEDCDKIVIVRGVVESAAAAKASWRGNNASGVLVAQDSGETGVIVQRIQTCIYNEWRAFGWTTDLRSILSQSLKDRRTSSMSLRMVPFILVETGNCPQSDYVTVNLDGSRHPLPLTTVYHQLQPISASPYTFLQAFLGFEYPIGLLDEEKILPLRKEITAVGICKLRNGTPEIKCCKDLPYFLCDLTKDQMLADLSFKTKVLLWSGVIFSSIAVGILGYSVARRLIRWKELRARQQNDPSINDSGPQVPADEDTSDIPEGQLCVVCLMSRRISAFVPCGHLVCCQRCAFSIEREASPKCPVCRQAIRSSVRIYDS